MSGLSSNCVLCWPLSKRRAFINSLLVQAVKMKQLQAEGQSGRYVGQIGRA